MVVIAQHAAALEQLQLTTIEGVRAYAGGGDPRASQGRGVLRIAATGADGQPLTLFLKRYWRTYKKDGLASLLRRGAVWSIARREWENSRALEAAGIRVAGLVAFGEDCGPFWENFSFIITEAALGTEPLDQFIQECRDRAMRRRVFDALARFVREMHAAGLASPDLFTRHVFLEVGSVGPRFCLIDMARLDRRRRLSAALRARDLAALNVTAPRQMVSAHERLRFLRIYAGECDRELVRLVRRRMNKLLTHGRFQRGWSVTGD
jgi:hypothetical protein